MNVSSVSAVACPRGRAVCDIFQARTNLERLLADKRVLGRVTIGSDNNLEVWPYRQSDTTKLQKLLPRERERGYVFEGFLVLIHPSGARGPRTDLESAMLDVM